MEPWRAPSEPFSRVRLLCCRRHWRPRLLTPSTKPRSSFATTAMPKRRPLASTFPIPTSATQLLRVAPLDLTFARKCPTLNATIRSATSPTMGSCARERLQPNAAAITPVFRQTCEFLGATWCCVETHTWCLAGSMAPMSSLLHRPLACRLSGMTSKGVTQALVGHCLEIRAKRRPARYRGPRQASKDHTRRRIGARPLLLLLL